MTIDLYTKAVLTVIALSLLGMAIRDGVPSASALGMTCGSDRWDPCYIVVERVNGIVSVK